MVGKIIYYFGWLLALHTMENGVYMRAWTYLVEKLALVVALVLNKVGKDVTNRCNIPEVFYYMWKRNPRIWFLKEESRNT